MKRMWAAIAVLTAAAMLIAGCPSTPTNKSPTAGFIVEKYVLFVGGSDTFNGSTSKDPDGKVKEYTWNFGDGSPAQTTADRMVVHTFSSTGAFNVSLQVKDDKGAKSKAVSEMVVVAPLPVANLSTVDTGTSVNFSIDTSSLGGRITDYAWNFGDLTPVVKGATAEHAYADNGTFKASLTLSFRGQTAASTIEVKVQNRAPRANITVGTLAPYYSNKAIAFSGSDSSDSDGNVTKWAWDFGDNGTDNTTAPFHIYVKPGTYPVKLTVTDNDGATGMTTMLVEVVKDLLIRNVTVITYVDPTNHTLGKVDLKVENKGEAKTPGTIRINVTSYKADKTVLIMANSTTNGGTWEPNTSENTITVGELLTDGFDIDGTWYLVEVFYRKSADGAWSLIDSGWYKK